MTFLIINFSPSSIIAEKKRSLDEALINIDGWIKSTPQKLDGEVIEDLDLDDYTFCSYSKDTRQVSLFVGYYLSLDKIGAVHSPLVCFPGQGWLISDEEIIPLKLAADDISFMSMIVTRGQHKQLTLYWYQAFDKTSKDTFYQKIYALISKYQNRREDNAFIRVIIPMNGQTRAEALKTGIAFIADFYPLFLKYVKEP